jgi:ribulose kinase
MKPLLKTVFRQRRDVAEKRLEICRTCEFFTHKTSRCNKCGCFMEYKALFLNSECPIGKWSKHNETSNT